MVKIIHRHAHRVNPIRRIPSSRIRKQRRHRKSFRPLLIEPLEDRRVLSTVSIDGNQMWNDRVYISWQNISHNYWDSTNMIVDTWKVDDNGDGDPRNDENRIQQNHPEDCANGLFSLLAGDVARIGGHRPGAKATTRLSPDGSGTVTLMASGPAGSITAEYTIKPSDENIYSRIIVRPNEDLEVQFGIYQIGGIWVSQGLGKLKVYDQVYLDNMFHPTSADIASKAFYWTEEISSPDYSTFLSHEKQWTTGLVVTEMDVPVTLHPVRMTYQYNYGHHIIPRANVQAGGTYSFSAIYHADRDLSLSGFRKLVNDGGGQDSPGNQVPGKGWRYWRSDRTGTNYQTSGTTVDTLPKLRLEKTIGSGAAFSLTGDVDSDGKRELVRVEGTSLQIFGANGDLQQSIILPHRSELSMLDDVDGDGTLDIGVASWDNTNAYVYLYDGSGRLLQTMSRNRGWQGHIRPAGVIKPGVVLAAAWADGHDPRGLFAYDVATGQEVWRYDFGRNEANLTSLADIDSDGKLEATVAWVTVHNGRQANGTSDGELYLTITDDDGKNLLTQVYPPPNDGNAYHLFHDLNRDGIYEIVGIESHNTTYSGHDKVHLYDLNGNTLATRVGPINETSWWAVADVDGDGWDNIVVGGHSEVAILDERLQVVRKTEDNGNVQLVSDLTGDGKLDIVTLTAGGLVRVYDRNLSLIDSLQLPTSVTANWTIADDVDSDGVVEMVIRSVYGSYVVGFEGIQRDVGDTMEASYDLGHAVLGKSLVQNDKVGDGEYQAKDVDMYRFELAETADVKIHARAANGSGLDSYVRLFDANGKQLQASSGPIDTQLAAGTYFVGVSAQPNRSYDPRRANSGRPGSSSGAYTLTVTAESPSPPPGTCVQVGLLCLAGKFKPSHDGHTATGDIVINNMIHVSGALSYNPTTKLVSGDGSITVGGIQVYDGHFEFDGQKAIADGLKKVKTALHDLGVDIYAGRIQVIDGGVRLQGTIALPKAFGSPTVDFSDPYYVDVTPSGADYHIDVTLPKSQKFKLAGVDFETSDVRLNVKAVGSAFEAIVSGTFKMDLGEAEVDVNLAERSGHYFRFYTDNGAAEWTLVGSMEAHNVDVGVANVKDLYVFLNTNDRTFQFNTTVQAKVGNRNLTFEGHLGVLQGYFDNIGLVGEGLSVPIWDKPPIYVDKAGGHIWDMAPVDDKPTWFELDAGIGIGPKIKNDRLLYLDTVARLSSKEISGDATLYLGGREKPLARGEVNVAWRFKEEFRVAGDLRVGNSGNPWLTANGWLLVGQDMARGAQHGEISIDALPKWIVGPAKFFGLMPDSSVFAASSYAQFSDDDNADNDFLMAGIKDGLTLRLDLKPNFSLLTHLHLADYDELESYLSGTGEGETVAQQYVMPDGVDSALFQLFADSGYPDLQLTGPDGTVYLPEDILAHPDDPKYQNVSYFRYPDVQAAVFALKQPMSGVWKVDVLDADGPDTYQVQALHSTRAPSIELLEPSLDTEDDQVLITWNDEDADSDATINLYYDDDRVGADGVLIAEGIREDDPADAFTWDTSGVPTGDYYVYAMIDDGTNMPEFSYSTGRVSVVQEGAPAAVELLRATTVAADTVELDWNPAPEGAVDHYLVRWTNAASGESYQHVQSTADAHLMLDSLTVGETYRISVSAVDGQGRVSRPSDSILVVAGGTQIVPPSEDEWPVFAEPGQPYVQLVPGSEGASFSARPLADGASLSKDGVFRWNVPEQASGWYEVVIDVREPTGESSVWRYRLFCDQDAPVVDGEQLLLTAASPEEIVVEAPRAFDVSGVVSYQLEPDGGEPLEWQAEARWNMTDLTPNSEHLVRFRTRDASPSAHTTTWSQPQSVWTMANPPGLIEVGDVTESTVQIDFISEDGNPPDTQYAIYCESLQGYVDESGEIGSEPVWQTKSQWAGQVVRDLPADTEISLAATARNGAGQTTELGIATTVRTLRETQPPVVTGVIQGAGEITVTFSEAVAIEQQDVGLADDEGNSFELPQDGFQYLPWSRSAVITVPSGLAPGHYAATFAGDAVQDLAANLLDGDGDGVGGDDYRYEFDVTTGVPSLTLDSDGSSQQPGGGYAAEFTEGDDSVAIADADAAVSDPDSQRFTLLEVSIDNPLDGELEWLSATVEGTAISADYADGTLTLFGRDGIANYQQVLRSVVYHNRSENPSADPRLVRVTVSDGINTSVAATATLTITPVNDPPVAAPDEFVCDENEAMTVGAPGLLDNDHDVDSSELRVRLTELPTHGSLELMEDGSFVYTPDPNYNREDSFRYVAHDGTEDGNTASVMVTIETAYPWYNGASPFDVTDDGYVAPIDALTVIDTLNDPGPRVLPSSRPRPLSAPFFDTNRSGQVSPIDALAVIDYLNQHVRAEGEVGVVRTISYRVFSEGPDADILPDEWYLREESIRPFDTLATRSALTPPHRPLLESRTEFPVRWRPIAPQEYRGRDESRSFSDSAQRYVAAEPYDRSTIVFDQLLPGIDDDVLTVLAQEWASSLGRGESTNS